AAEIRQKRVRCLELLEASIRHPAFVPASIVLAVALVLPSARAGLYFDDYIFLGVLSGSSPLSDVYPSRLDIFNFYGGSPERTRRMLDLGLLPWWTSPDSRLAFWRPVSALTHWLDYSAWRDLPALMHLQSLLWGSGLVVTVPLLYRGLMGTGAAAGGAGIALCTGWRPRLRDPLGRGAERARGRIVRDAHPAAARSMAARRLAGSIGRRPGVSRGGAAERRGSRGDWRLSRSTRPLHGPRG